MNVISTLEGVPGINSDFIEHDIDAFGAKKRMKEISYDLVIIDIAIPNRKGESIDLEGGIKLLNEIITRGIYKIPMHIIGLTVHEEIFAKADTKFGAQVLSVIRYSLSDIEWQNKLIAGVKQWMNSKDRLDTSIPEYNYDVAIITALDKELAAVKKLSQNWKRVIVPNDASSYQETTFIKDEKAIRVIVASAPRWG